MAWNGPPKYPPPNPPAPPPPPPKGYGQREQPAKTDDSKYDALVSLLTLYGLIDSDD